MVLRDVELAGHRTKWKPGCCEAHLAFCWSSLIAGDAENRPPRAQAIPESIWSRVCEAAFGGRRSEGARAVGCHYAAGTEQSAEC